MFGMTKYYIRVHSRSFVVKKHMKKWFGRLIKISFFLIAFLAIVLTVFVNMGGNSDTLKISVQDYITAASGYRAEIGTFHEMKFFPTVTIDFSDLKLHRDNDTIPEASIDSALLQIGFWDVITRSNKIRNLQIEGASFLPGTINKNPVEIDRLSIDEDTDGQAFLILDGRIGAAPLNGEIALQTIGQNYKIGEQSRFTFTAGGITAKGEMRPRRLGGFHIRDASITHNNTQVLSGAFSIVRKREEGLVIRGDLKSAQNRTETEIDIAIDGAQTITGSLDAFVFDMADFETGSRIMNALAAWQDIFALNNKPLDFELALKAQTFINNGQSEHNAALVLQRENGSLEIHKQTIGAPTR